MLISVSKGAELNVLVAPPAEDELSGGQPLLLALLLGWYIAWQPWYRWWR
jgi:hypothetical protein